jgi:MazG family protein
VNSPSDAQPAGIPAAPEAAPTTGAAPSTPAPAHAAAAAEYARLLAIMARLRRPGDGCPWDLEQTLDSLKPYLIEEAYEALDALETHNRDDLVEELGDLLLQIVFIAQVGSETALFDMADVARGISDKLIRRHPHIFGTESAPTTADVLRNWDKIKRDEKKTRTSALDGIPSHVPPLHRAYQLQKRAARAGFDWADVDGAMAKLREEVGELGEAIAEDSRAHMMEELGDVLFAAVKVARFLQCDPHYALSKTNDKFERRFRAMESEILAEGKTLKDCTLPEMEAHWNRHRAADKTPR